MDTKTSYVKSLLLLIVFFGCGCSPQKTERSETEVAIAFFDAIYNQKNLQKAITLSSKRFKKEVKEQRSARNFARRLLHLSFDTVEIETQKAKAQVLDDFSRKITMTVLFTGKRDGGIYKDVKKVLLVKEGDIWLVDQLLIK